jgi:hypothetical protein
MKSSFYICFLTTAQLQQNKTENAENRGKRRNSRNTNIDSLVKSPFQAVIPEVFNRESILFKKLRVPGFPPSRE